MHSARARYLLAMGLLPVGLSTACHRKGEAESAPPPLSDASVQPPPEKSAVTPTVRIERVDAGDGAWHVRTHRPPPQKPQPYAMPSCPSGQYCVTTSTTSANGERAAAPFEDCATTSMPPGQTWGQSRFDPELTKSERDASPKACCYSWYQPCPGGRPLRSDDGSPIVAATTMRRDWSAAAAPLTFSLTFETHARLAAYWTEQAAAEHASVASFNRFALQLLALGAPPDMVKAAMEAGLDEIRHAAMCYGLAARYSGEPVGPGRLALPQEAVPVDPVVVALETLRDGCLGESIAAEIAREAARSADDHEVIAVLEEIAADEERHAELAWRSLAWLVAHQGEPVRTAIAAFVDELTIDSIPDGRDVAGVERAHGMVSAAEQLRIRALVVREIALPCIAALVAPTRDPLAASAS